jgi:hypothetical protein
MCSGSRVVLAGLVLALAIPQGVVAQGKAEPREPAGRDCRSADFGRLTSEESEGAFPYWVVASYTGRPGWSLQDEIRTHLDRVPTACKATCPLVWAAAARTIETRRERLASLRELTTEINERVAKWPANTTNSELTAGGRSLALAEAREELRQALQAAREAQKEVQDAAQAWKDCLCRCYAPTGKQHTARIAGASAVAGALALGLAAAGGGSPAGTPPPAGPPTSTPPGTSPTPTGTYVMSWTTVEDNRNSAGRVQLQSVREVQITVEGRRFTMVGPAPLPFLEGTWDATSQQVTASGAGPIAGRERVGVSLAGTLTSAGALRALVAVGEDGSLGGELPHVVRYQADGARR